MAFPSRLRIGAAVALVIMTACGDEKGYPSLEAFYGASPDRASSSSGGSSSSSGGTSTDVTCGIGSTGLLAYLPLDGDTQVLGSALRVTNPPSSSSFVSGQFGQALTGSKQLFLETTKSLSLSTWTACAWVRVTSDSNIGFLAIPGDTALNSGIAEPGLIPGCGTGGVAPYVSTNSSTCVVAPSMALRFGDWNFLCIVNDASQLRIHVNGIAASTGSAMSTPLSIDSGTAIAIGGGPPGSNAIDELSFWSRALSTSELETLSTTRCSGGDGESP